MHTVENFGQTNLLGGPMKIKNEYYAPELEIIKLQGTIETSVQIPDETEPQEGEFHPL